MTDPPIDVGSRKQLFIDGKFIDRQVGVALRMNPPRKGEKVLLPETPVESHRVGCYSQIIRLPDEWWMYYTAIPLGSFDYDPVKRDGSGYMVCLATSQDGLHWQRKNVNLYAVHGSKENNVVIPNAYGSVLVDPRESDGHRYWFVANMKQSSLWKEADGLDYSSGLYLLKSRDGINWKRHPGQALPFYMDTDNQAIYDARLGKYVAYLRSWLPGKDRCVSRLEFGDILSLPWPHKPFDPLRQRPMVNVLMDEIPTVMQSESSDPAGTDIYTPSVEPYEGADSVYLAFPSRYRHYDGFDSYGRDMRGKHENDGVLDIALAVSRDGVNWTRFAPAYISPGEVGQDDAGSVYMGMGIIKHGSELWQHYFGLPERSSFYQQSERVGALTRVIQRLDGFVSADAGPEGGELTTPVIRFDGSRLQLNVDCGAMGEAWVEVEDAEGRPVAGYTMAESVSVDRNGVAQEVWWQGGPDVTKLAGTPIRLHIKMRSAKLYAFQFVGGG